MPLLSGHKLAFLHNSESQKWGRDERQLTKSPENGSGLLEINAMKPRFTRLFEKRGRHAEKEEHLRRGLSEFPLEGSQVL
jgi:hypothetical protein